MMMQKTTRFLAVLAVGGMVAGCVAGKWHHALSTTLISSYVAIPLHPDSSVLSLSQPPSYGAPAVAAERRWLDFARVYLQPFVSHGSSPSRRGNTALN